MEIRFICDVLPAVLKSLSKRLSKASRGSLGTVNRDGRQRLGTVSGRQNDFPVQVADAVQRVFFLELMGGSGF